MATNDELTTFIKDALSRGTKREDVQAVLVRAGWEAPQVRAALDGFADIDFPIPVPRPRANFSARDAFLYLLLFGTLYVSAYNFGSLLYQFIDRAFPDPAARNPAQSLAYASLRMRWAISSLIVAVPVFLFVSSLARRAVRRDVARHGTDVRRALTYLTLLIASAIVIGDVIVLIYSALGGELTIRFILKALTIGSIAGAVFGYYLQDVRSEDSGLRS